MTVDGLEASEIETFLGEKRRKPGRLSKVVLVGEGDARKYGAKGEK